MVSLPGPVLSVIIPTFNNLAVLTRCLASWQQCAQAQPIEILVINDGCRDGTQDYLKELARTPWGARYVRWENQNDVHELKCTNRGFAEASAPLTLAWQDDMFLQRDWLVGELIANLDRYPEIGLLGLSRGLNCFPLEEPILEWENLIDWRRLQSTIGYGPLNWFRLQEVDTVIRPWVVRRECLDEVGLLDEAFCPTEWDEADLCFRIRKAGWKIATHGYERLGAFRHLGSSTMSRTPSLQHQKLGLRNGQLFHRRWDETIRLEHPRARRTWWRRSSVRGWMRTFQQVLCLSFKHQNRLETCEQDA